MSYPQPYNSAQESLVSNLTSYLEERGFEPRTLGVTDYDMGAPLKAIRRLMMESKGLITIAFRRSKVVTGKAKPESDAEYTLDGCWLTSPYSHIEPAMAFQIGLPVLILRERGVIPDGILEQGVLGTYMPEFDLENPSSDYLKSNEFGQLIRKWESQVERVFDNKGNPPQLY